MFSRFFRFALFLLSAAAVVAQTAKRPLNHRDYDNWRVIQSQVLSPDGKFLAYSLMPEDGDGNLVVKNLATGKELRENCGAAPPAAEDAGEEPAGVGVLGEVSAPELELA